MRCLREPCRFVKNRKYGVALRNWVLGAAAFLLAPAVALAIELPDPSLWVQLVAEDGWCLETKTGQTESEIYRRPCDNSNQKQHWQVVPKGDFVMLRGPDDTRNRDPEQEMLLVVAPSGSVAGIVSDANGTPLADVAIETLVRPLADFPLPLDPTVPAEFSGTKMLSGKTGVNGDIKTAFNGGNADGRTYAGILGKTRYIPIYSGVTGNGSNAQFTIIKFVAARVMEVQMTGNPKSIVLQPVTDVNDLLGLRITR